ncbi:hypothetical protein [Streptomyces ambofaciens]
MAERLPHSPCRRTDRHDAHEFEVYARPFWCPGFAPSGPACGNNPNYRMSDGDRQAVDSFRAYLTARGALQRIRTVLETEAVVGRTALEYRGLITAALMADETAATETAHQPRRGDQFEAWLKAQRDEYEVESGPQWRALDEVLDTYRLHADTGTPLGEHVCEGQAVGDCECLEQPAAGARQDRAQQ